MKRKINLLLLVCLCLSMSACSKPKPFTIDKAFTTAFIGSDKPSEVSNALILNENDHQTLLDKLKVDQWAKVNSSTHDSTAYMHLSGTSKAIYSFYQKDLTTFIDIDTNKDGDPELFYSTTKIDCLDIKLWVEDLNLSVDRFNALKDTEIFEKAFLGSTQSLDQLRQLTLSATDMATLKDLLNLDQWVHISELPSLDPLNDVKCVIESKNQGTSVLLSIYSKNNESYVVLSSPGSEDSNFQLNTTISDAIQAFLENLWNAIIPSDDLPSIRFSQAYIGQTQYIYETDALLPEYLFSLTETQNMEIRSLFDFSTWNEVSDTYLYEDAEFVLITATGAVLYASGDDNSYSIWLDSHGVKKHYVSDANNFQAINDAINSYFIPAAPSLSISDAVYTFAEYYEGPIQDMTSPDLSITLTAAQSNTIKNFLNPTTWRQAFDIPPMGPAIIFLLTDENGVNYAIVTYVSTYVLISVRVNDKDRPVLWMGSQEGATNARNAILSMAP